MAYSVEADIRKQSPFKNATLITPSYVNQKIDEADAIINGMIGGTYQMPLVYVPPIIVNLSKQLTTLILFREQDINIEVQPGIDIEAEWKVQMSTLESIAKRAIKLLNASGVELALNSSALPSGYPNNASSDPSSPSDTSPKFTMNRKF